MQNRLKSIALFLAAMLAAVQTFAGNWTNFSNYIQVTSFATRGNEIWISDKAGLVMYDKVSGQQTFFKKGPDALPSLTVERVAVHPQTSSIWIGTYDNGLAQYNGTVWTHIPFPDDNAMLYEMKIAPDGAVWAATTRGLYKYQNAAFTTYLPTPYSSASPIWDFDFAPNGKLFCGANQPFFYDPATDNMQVLTTTAFAYGSCRVLTIDDHHFVFSGDHGTVATFTDTTETDTFEINTLAGEMQMHNGNLLLLFDYNKNVYERMNGQVVPYNLGSANGSITSIYVDAANSVWAGSDLDGGRVYHKSNLPIVEELGLRHSSINWNWVSGIKPDGEGNFLVVEGTGIQRVDPATGVFTNPFFWEPPVAPNDIEAANGKFYAGTSYMYLQVYDDINGWLKYGEGVLPSPEVDHLTHDNQGNIWMVGPGYIAKFSSGNFTIYDKNNNSRLSDNLYMRDIHYDATRDAIWAVSYNGIFKLQNGVLSFYNDSTTPGIQQYYDAVETIEEDAQHNIWFGTIYGGVIKYDGTNWSTMLLPETAGNQTITDIKFIDDRMYVSDNLHGVYFYENAAWDSFTVGNSPISDRFITSMAVDANNNLWMGNLSHGIDVYNKNGLTLAVKEVNTALDVKVFPNPSKGVFTITLPSVTVNTGVQIMGVDGRLVWEGNGTDKFTVDLSAEQPGLYLARFKNQNGMQVTKLLLTN